MSESDQPPASPPDQPDRRGYLLSTLATLWPPPCTVTTDRPRAPEASATVQLVVVPHLERPTLVVPRRPRRVTAAGIKRYKTSAGRSTRLKLSMLSLAAGAGLTDALPHRVFITCPPGDPQATIVGHLSEALGREVFVSLYIGVSRAVEKPVLQVLGPRGEPVGFAKIGVNVLTRGLVRGEAASLRRLSGAAFSTITVPTLLHAAPWRDHEVMVQEALHGDGSRELDRDVLIAATTELAGLGSTSQELRASAFLAGLRDRVRALSAGGWSDRMRETLERCVGDAGTTVLAFGGWHGDWAPWNMAPSGRRLVTWDWEHFGTDVPAGFDALHFHIQDQLVSANASAADAVADASRRAVELVAPMGVPAEHADLVLTLYLIEIATRYLHDGEHKAGTRMGQLGSWLDAALSRQLGVLSARR